MLLPPSGRGFDSPGGQNGGFSLGGLVFIIRHLIRKICSLRILCLLKAAAFPVVRYAVYLGEGGTVVFN